MKTVNNKKRLTIALSIALVLAIALGGTLAYLFAQTNIESNVFTFAENVKGLLTEPKWDPEEAEDLVPGMIIDKDPQITNISNNGVDVYTSIKLVFTDGAGETLSEADMTKLMGLIEINYSSAWTIADADYEDMPEQIWLYNSILAPAYTSTPLFTTVTIKYDVTPEELNWLAGIYNHEAECFAFGTCACTPTVIHHKNCAIHDDDDCDCTPTSRHQNGCPAWIGSLTGDCECEMVDGLGGFIIVVHGGIVQADAFDDLADATAALIAVFGV